MDESYCFNLCSDLGTKLTNAAGQLPRFARNEGKCLKSLKRIRKEINADTRDERNDAVILFGDIGILRNWLIPLAINYGDRDEAMLAEVVKVAVQLTMPLGVADSRNRVKRLEHLRIFKSDFLNEGALHAFLRLLERPLAATGAGRRREDKLLVELVLWLLRNLLAIPDASGTHGPGSTKNAHHTHLHEDFLVMLSREGILDLIVYLGEYVGTEGNKEWNLILLEIFFQIFRGAQVEDLFQPPQRERGPAMVASADAPTTAPSAGLSDGTAPANLRLQQSANRIASLSRASEEQNDQLASLLLQSRAKRVQADRSKSSRHARFAGMLQLSGAKSNGTANTGGIVGNAFAARSASERSVASAMQGGLGKKSGRRKGRDAYVDEHQAQAQQMLQSSVRSHAPGRVLAKMQNDLCGKVIERCYKPLFEALKNDFSREDSRLVPADHVQFLWLAGICTGFERERHERDGSAGEFEWHKSPVIKTMDLWTFHYVIKSCQMYDDTKKHMELEVSTRALKEMLHLVAVMQKSENTKVRRFVQTLRNRVFYDISELELIVTLIRNWNAEAFSWRHLANLGYLGGLLVDIAAEMAADHVIVKAKSRGGGSTLAKAAERSRAASRIGKAWSAEETHALAEAMNSATAGSGTMKNCRKALRDPHLGAIFDSSRTPEMLFHRWAQVSRAMADRKVDLETFLRDEVADEEARGGADALAGATAEEEARRAEEELERQRVAARREKTIEVQGVLRPYTAMTVVRNLCQLLDPTLIPSAAPEPFVRALHEEVLVPFLERFDTLNQGCLWHVSLFAVFARTMEAFGESRRPKLHACIKAVLAAFFTHAKQNPLAFAELLMTRNKTENLLMVNFYEDPADRKARLEEERRRDRAAARRERRERGDADSGPESDGFDSDDLALSSGDEDAVRTKRRRLEKQRSLADQDDSDGEEEADLGQVRFCGKTRRSRPARKAAAAPVVRWTPQESQDLINNFEQLALDMPNREVEVLLALDAKLGTAERTVDRIREQLVRLRVLDASGKVRGPRPCCTVSEGDASVKRQVAAAIEAGHITTLNWIADQIDDQRRVLVPRKLQDWDGLDHVAVSALLRLLGFRPHPDSGFWRVCDADLVRLRELRFNEIVRAVLHGGVDGQGTSLDLPETEATPMAGQQDVPYRAEFDLLP